MIIWVIVWVLNIQYVDGNASHSYQRTYATREQCVKALKRSKDIEGSFGRKSCDFQQVPMVVNK